MMRSFEEREMQRVVWASKWIMLAMGVIVASSCTLTLPEESACRSDESCVQLLGPGALCQGSPGYCAPLERHPRCTRSYPEDFLDDPAAYKDAIVFGGSYDYEAHLDTLKGTELAFREVNSSDAGGLDQKRSFAIVFCDYGERDQYDDGLDSNEAAGETARYLARVFDVPAIIGPRGSSRTKVVFEAVRDQGVLVISPSATSTELIGLDTSAPSDAAPGLLWRTAAPDSFQGRVIARDVAERAAQARQDTSGAIRQIERVGLIYQRGSYGDGLKNVFVDALGVRDAGITVEQFPFSSDTPTSLSSAIGQALNAQVDEFLFVSSDLADAVSFLTTPTLAQSLQGRTIFLTDAAYNTDLLSAFTPQNSSVLDALRGTRPAPSEGVVYTTFLAGFNLFYREDATQGSAFTPHAYDAAWLVIYGAAWSYYNEGGEVTGEGIARGLRHMSMGEEVAVGPGSWSKVRTQFKERRSIDVKGASGTLDFDPIDEETSAPIEVWRVNAAHNGLEAIEVVEKL